MRGIRLLPATFLLTPLREGRQKTVYLSAYEGKISTHAPAGGATDAIFKAEQLVEHFYSRPCGRGDEAHNRELKAQHHISTHAPAGGATEPNYHVGDILTFLLTPLREGRPMPNWSLISPRIFLLTPLREGRPPTSRASASFPNFYSRPCGRGDRSMINTKHVLSVFLLTPLREGRLDRQCGTG